jgi:hypothetical protein
MRRTCRERSSDPSVPPCTSRGERDPAEEGRAGLGTPPEKAEGVPPPEEPPARRLFDLGLPGRVGHAAWPRRRGPGWSPWRRPLRSWPALHPFGSAPSERNVIRCGPGALRRRPDPRPLRGCQGSRSRVAGRLWADVALLALRRPDDARPARPGTQTTRAVRAPQASRRFVLNFTFETPSQSC